MENAECTTCDIVFVGASVPNLLSTIALHERFEGIKIKILEAAASLKSNEHFLMVVSHDAWRSLMELSPRLCSLICKRNLFLNAEESSACGSCCSSERRFLLSNELYSLLLSELPNEEIQLNQSVTEITETSDTVTFCTQTGDQYKTKMLITDEHTKGVEADPTDFVEIAFTTSPDRIQGNEWQNEEIYIKKERVKSEEFFSALIKASDLSAKSVRYQLQRIPELAEGLAGSRMKSFVCRQLSKCSVTCSHGRTAISGCWSSFIPHFSSLKAEFEFEEVVLLMRAIEERGLTAAAISYWKRCQIASSKTQILSNMTSPMELFSVVDELTNPTKPFKASAASCCHIKQANQRASDVGKPLICTQVKPYMALS